MGGVTNGVGVDEVAKDNGAGEVAEAVDIGVTTDRNSADGGGYETDQVSNEDENPFFKVSVFFQLRKGTVMKKRAKQMSSWFAVATSIYWKEAHAEVPGPQRLEDFRGSNRIHLKSCPATPPCRMWTWW